MWLHVAGQLIYRLVLLVVTCIPHHPLEPRIKMFPKLTSYVDARIAEFNDIDDVRKEMLNRLADYVTKCTAEKKPCQLIFVCTHNSRRSHLSQAWAQVAATHFGVPGVVCFSGGTEATAMNPRTVEALRRAGFDISVAVDQASASNPKYQVKYADELAAVEYFSKCTGDKPNPTQSFAAIMTCTEADKACPMVIGCSFRLGLPFQDPKISDGTPEESATYDLRCRQIAREMLYVMSQVKVVK